ncbi:MAG: DUF4153 domain-containing protein [Actinomycetota bacterium]
MDGRGASLPPRPDVPRPEWMTAGYASLDLAIDRAADLRVLVAAGAAAMATDLAVRSGGVGTAGALLVVAVAGGILATGRIRNPQAVALVASAPLFGAWLMVRTSPWLIPLDAVAVAGLLVAGASLARGGSVFDLSPVPLLVRGAHAVAHGLAGPAFLVSPVAAARRGTGGDGRRTGRGVARGAAVAVPVLVVLGVLLGSADPVFASWFQVPADPVDVVAHGVLLALGAWGMAGLLRVASATSPRSPDVVPPRFRGVEAFVVLAGLDGLYAAFAVAQVISASGGARRVLEARGLTYAEYARSGFFQLVAVAVITLVVLLVLRAVTDTTTRHARAVFLALALVAVALTLVIVDVAVHRMRLYERAFGLTMLRLYVEVAMLGIALVFVALAVRLTGVRASRQWLTPVALGLALALVLALDVANPESLVARRNVALAARTGHLDVGYLASLSDDAVPTLVEASSRLSGPDRRALRNLLCPPPDTERFHGWAAWNASRDHAAASLEAFCPARSG